MSDLLGPLLGMSPYLAYGCPTNGNVLVGSGGTAANAVDYPGLARYGRCCTCGQRVGNGALEAQLSGLQNACAQAVMWQPPPEPPGIHWNRTGGKSWRVVIVRSSRRPL
jgi:hypothetical protein